MFQKVPDIYIHEAYFALEKDSSEKHEYYQGEVFAMSGAFYNHNIIASNVTTLLNQATQSKNCVTLGSDMRVYVVPHDLFTYPDVMVVCDPPEFALDRNDTINNPLVLV